MTDDGLGGSKADFITEASKIKGLGKVKAEQLYDSGFHSIEELRASTLEDVSGVGGFTKLTAQKIIDGAKSSLEETRKLIANLKSNDWEIRARSAVLLGKKKEKLAVKSLIKALKDNRINDERVVNTQYFNGHVDSKDSWIEQKTHSDEFTARVNIAWALGEIGDKRAIGTLIWALDSAENGLNWSDAFMKPEEGSEWLVEMVFGPSKTPYYIDDLFRAVGSALIKISRGFLDDKEFENISKFLKSKDAATVRMGASMLKGILKE